MLFVPSRLCHHSPRAERGVRRDQTIEENQQRFVRASVEVSHLAWWKPAIISLRRYLVIGGEFRSCKRVMPSQR